MEKILKFMKEIMPGISTEVDMNTFLDDIWFDQFCCELLVRKLNREYVIAIPDSEVDTWKKIGDIVASVEKRC